MRLKNLSHRNAFVNGSDLWITSDLKSSTWTRKINWYLNFQIYKFKKTKKLSSTQLSKLQEDGFNIKNISAKADAILIGSARLLTNKVTLIITFKNLSKWIESSKVHWESLGRPSLRFFTPDSLNSESLVESIGRSNFDLSKVTIVPEYKGV